MKSGTVMIKGTDSALQNKPKQLDILLIHPPNLFLKQGYGIKRKASFGHAPPLGIGYVASLLEHDKHRVRILDASAMQLTIAETVREVGKIKPDVIGLSVLTNYADMASKLADEIKKAFPEITIVLGGAHATYFFREILEKMPSVDFVLYGEVDSVILDFFRHLGEPQKLKEIRGLVYRDPAGKIVVNDPPELLDDLDTIPHPAWHLYDFSLYRPLPLQYRRKSFFTMITSRGCCWGKCKFCFQAGRNKSPYRRHSVDRVISEIEVLYHQYGIREIAFWDDTFILNPRWIEEFAAELKERSLDITWVASGRVNQMDEKTLRTVHSAGCWSIFVGVESGNQDLLDAIEKGTTLEQCRRIFALTRKIGLQTRGAFMLGLPGETPAKGRRTIDFALELDPTYAVFYAAHPRFGTELYDIAMTQGSFLTRDFRGMSKITYVPAGYQDAQELAKLIKSAYRRFYFRPRYVFRVLKNIRSISDVLELLKSFILFLGLADAN